MKKNGYLFIVVALTAIALIGFHATAFGATSNCSSLCQNCHTASAPTGYEISGTHHPATAGTPVMCMECHQQNFVTCFNPVPSGGKAHSGVFSVTVGNKGSGYTSAPIVTIAPPTSGTTATATATLGTGADVGKVASVTVTNGGSGYTTAPTVTFSGGGGSGATATASLGSGADIDIVAIACVGCHGTNTCGDPFTEAQLDEAALGLHGGTAGDCSVCHTTPAPMHTASHTALISTTPCIICHSEYHSGAVQTTNCGSCHVAPANPVANFFYACDGSESGRMNLNAAPSTCPTGSTCTYSWSGNGVNGSCNPSSGLTTSCLLNTPSPRLTGTVELTVTAIGGPSNGRSDIEPKTLTLCTVTAAPDCGIGTITYPNPLLKDARLTVSTTAGNTVTLINWGDTKLTPGALVSDHTYAYDGKYAVRWTVQTTSTAGVTKRLACGPVYATIAASTATKNTVTVNVPATTGIYTTVKVLTGTAPNLTVKSQGSTAGTTSWTSAALPGPTGLTYTVTVYKYGKVYGCTGTDVTPGPTFTGYPAGYNPNTKTWSGTADLTAARSLTCTIY